MVDMNNILAYKIHNHLEWVSVMVLKYYLFNLALK
jgi:hypothetical protein